MSKHKTYSNDWFPPAAQGNDEWGRHVFGPRWNLVKYLYDLERNSFGELIGFTAEFHDGHKEQYTLDRIAKAEGGQQ